jgi:hypothetical protein
VDIVFFEEFPIGRTDQVNGTHPYGFDLGAEFFEAERSHGPSANAVVDVAFECRRSRFFEIKRSKGPHGCSAKDHFFEGIASSRIESHGVWG